MTEAESGTAPDVGAAAKRVIRLSVADLQGAASVRSTSVLFCDGNVRPPACVGVLNRAAAVVGPIGGELTVTGLGSVDAHQLRSAGLHAAIHLGVDADHWLMSPGVPSRPHRASNRQPVEAPLTGHHATEETRTPSSSECPSRSRFSPPRGGGENRDAQLSRARERRRREAPS
jgi:hypothetical protein